MVPSGFMNFHHFEGKTLNPHVLGQCCRKMSKKKITKRTKVKCGTWFSEVFEHSRIGSGGN